MSLANTPLISEEQLKGAKRVLYMTHLAIGDFVFQGVYLEALKARFPHLQLDIWIDDCRNKAKVWHQGRNDTLVQWLSAQPFIGEVYPIAESSVGRDKLVEQARRAGYDIVFFIASQRSESYAKYARRITPNGLAVGSRSRPRNKWLSKLWYFSRLDGVFDLDKQPESGALHISQRYQERFEACVGPLFNSKAEKRQLQIAVPEQFKSACALWLKTQTKASGLVNPRVILINHLSTNARRNLSWAKVCEFIGRAKKQLPGAFFVINVPPDAKNATEQAIEDSQLDPTCVIAYSATEHFFQLPALLQASDLVITVETAIMHLASTLRVPQVVLMRHSANAWQPICAEQLLLAPRKVDDIQVTEILNAMKHVLSNSPAHA